jgi:hypothetical protein
MQIYETPTRALCPSLTSTTLLDHDPDPLGDLLPSYRVKVARVCINIYVSGLRRMERGVTLALERPLVALNTRMPVSGGR